MASLKGQYGRIGSASRAKGGETRFFSVIKGIPDLPLLINDLKQLEVINWLCCLVIVISKGAKLQLSASKIWLYYRKSWQIEHESKSRGGESSCFYGNCCYTKNSLALKNWKLEYLTYLGQKTVFLHQFQTLSLVPSSFEPNFVQRGLL